MNKRHDGHDEVANSKESDPKDTQLNTYALPTKLSYLSSNVLD